MAETTTKLESKSEIIAKYKATKAIEEIFGGIHPAGVKTSFSTVFTPETAGQFMQRVGGFSALLSAQDSHQAALEKLDAAIAKAEAIRDEVLAKVFEKIRPIERSYRELHLFFENSQVKDGVQRDPVEFFIFNADPKAFGDMTDPSLSTTIENLSTFIRSRNDTMNFRQYICNLVVPGYVKDSVRKGFEELANQWGLLLIGDLQDEPSYRQLADQFRPGGAYEFLKRPDDKAASDVVVAGHVKLRDRHWFERPEAEDPNEDPDLYGPASMIFAGALARTDRMTGGGIAQGPVGMIFGKIAGIEKARVEMLVSQMEQLSMERQVVTMIRNSDNELCFAGSRTQAEDPEGALKFFTSYRVLRYLERRIAVYLRTVAEQRLTRDLIIDQIKDPIEKLLEEEKAKGTIHHAELDVEMDPDLWAQGQLPIRLSVLPVGPAETFDLKIEVPKPDKKAS